MRLPDNRNLPLAALAMLLAFTSTAQARDRTEPIRGNGPQADYPMVLGKPFAVDGVTYTPADTLNYDVVGLAATTTDGGNTVTASHRTLPLPSYVEITALDSGRTILVRLERRGPMTGGLLTQLSPGAAEQLGILGQANAPVRVRRVNPPEPERSALRAGRPAPARMDTPPSLRTVLMRRLEQQGAGAQVSRTGPMLSPDRLPAGGGAGREPVPPAPRPAVAPLQAPPKQVQAAQGPVRGGWFVQAGAYSNPERAKVVAASLGGQVVAGGGLQRVRITGLASQAAAEAALDKVRAAGYTDARIQRAD